MELCTINGTTFYGSPLCLQVPATFDEHENGQTRIGVAGEQMPLLPLPDEKIPTACDDSDVDAVRDWIDACRD
jgi:hypothetical protein